jgi:hypothetical protein
LWGWAVKRGRNLLLGAAQDIALLRRVRAAPMRVHDRNDLRRKHFLID